MYLNDVTTDSANHATMADKHVPRILRENGQNTNKHTWTHLIWEPSTEAYIFCLILTQRTSRQGAGTDEVGNRVIIPHYHSTVLYIIRFYDLRIQVMDMMNVNRIKQEVNNTSQRDFLNNSNLAESKKEQDHGLHIKQETVDDQNDTFQLKEECIVQWDDSPVMLR